MRKLRVGVLMGGKSIEKEVSFNSGRTICDHLDTSRYEIFPIFQTTQGDLFFLPWHFLHRGKISDFEHRLAKEAELVIWDNLKKSIDFVYIATHGQYAEDGTLQGILEVLGLPYLGSGIFASAIRMDKIIHKKILQAAGIETPHYCVVTANQIKAYQKHKKNILNILTKNAIKFPCIVKPYNEGSSFGISVVHNQKELKKALEYACYVVPGEKKKVIIEEKLLGMEFTCITLVNHKTGNYITLPPTEIVLEKNKNFYDYEQKYMPGRVTKFTPARCSKKIMKKIQDICIKTMKTLEFSTISRIDGFVTPDKRIVIIDPNTLSGMAPSSFIFNQAAEIGMSHTDVINHIIETELKQYGMLDAIIAQEHKEEKRMNKKKTRVAVLLGGRSNEKEISLESGRNVIYKLSPQTYQAIPIFVSGNLELFKLTQSQLVRNSTKEIESLLTESQKIAWQHLPIVADFVFNALHGGEGENGAIQGTLEMLELPYNGSSVLTSALCIDKYKTANFLKAEGFATPRNMLIQETKWKSEKQYIIENIEKQFLFPFVVKPHNDGCSIMVQKANNRKDLLDIINAIFKQNKRFILIEELINGMELTIGVIGNDQPRALLPSQTIAQQEILSIEEKFLPGTGENQTPAALPTKALLFVQNIAELVYKKLNCKGYARIDCFYQTPQISPTHNERVVILEVNTLPGMTPATCLFHQAAEIGLKPMDFIDHIIQLGFEQHRKIVVSNKTQSIRRDVVLKKNLKKHL